MSAPFAIHTHHSNRTEHLVDALAEVVARPCGGPFTPETIVVQGRGMAAYLTQQLATRLGVWAHADFRFPRRYMETCLQAVLGDETRAGMVSEDQLTWLVLSSLQTCIAEPGFARLARYLENDPNGLKRFQLARRLGTLFDRYITYRPEMVQAFERGEDGGVEPGQRWQALLWQRLAPKLKSWHWAALEPRWHQRAREITKAPAGLPARVCLFGLSSLPPQYLRVVAAASRWVQTHLFVFSPSDQDWWNSATRSEWARVVAAGQDPETTYVDPGHPLLSSCGAVGADFRRVLQTTFDSLQLSESVDERFLAIEPISALTQLQADVYALRKPVPHEVLEKPVETRRGRKSKADAAQMALPFAAVSPVAEVPAPREAVDDESIRVHACHSPMREVEVLKDQLLALLTRKHDPVLPHEVVVMMADVDTYAPFVEAVFSEQPTSPTYIPFRIADRKLRVDSPVIDAFFRALDLIGSRLTAPSVVDLLTARAVERHLGLAASDLDRFTSWVVESGIRWGIDATHRAEHDQPADIQNTWRFGFNRLLLGYAMPAEGESSFAGVMPYDEIEGKSAADLGVFIDFLERLFDHLRGLRQPRRLPLWRQDLLSFLEDLVGLSEATDWEHQHLRQALAQLEADAAAAGFDDDVDLGVVRSWLQERVENALPERGFLAGGVTFCAMVPMRSIPFRVVCLVGMNDGVFPRAYRGIEFDLVARGPAGPQPGDRDRRLDDRYLFLETLCAARERLIVTYTGQSVRDNAVRPPSVLLNELYDALALHGGEDTLLGQRREAAMARVLVRHPLQGFSRRYFNGADARLWSYASNFQAVAQTQTLLQPAPAFIERALPPSPPDLEISLRDLEQFWRDPLAFFLQRRVRVSFRESGEDMPSREPTQLDPLSRHEAGSLLVHALCAGAPQSASRAAALVRATGLLPLGSLGQVCLEALMEQAEGISRVVRPLRQNPRPAMHFDQALAPGVRLVGTLDQLFEDGLLQHQFGQLRARQQVAVWLRHLLLCWLQPKGVAMRSTFVGREANGVAETLCWNPVPEPEKQLRQFVDLFRVGQAAPLRFLPEAALAFVRPGSGRDRSDPITRAQKAFIEVAKHKLHWRRVLGDEGPPFSSLVTQGPSFDELARTLLQPLLAHQQAQGQDP